MTMSSTAIFTGNGPAAAAFGADAWSAEWIDLKAPTIQPPRSGHVAFVHSSKAIAPNDEKNDKEADPTVYIFGGYAEEEQQAPSTSFIGDEKEQKEATEDEGDKKQPPHRYAINDLWKFDNTSKEWKLVKDIQNHPQQRLAAAAASLPKYGLSFVFGGWDPQEMGTGGVILNDICQFDGKDWNVLSSSDKNDNGQTGIDLGDKTSRLVAVTISDNTILLHNHRCTDHVLLFVVQEEAESKKFTYKLIKQPTAGTSPSPRGLHVAACIGGNNNKNEDSLNSKEQQQQQQLIVFGGAAQDGTMSNEVFALNLQTWEWNKVMECFSSNDNVEIPSPRASPCFCVLEDDANDAKIIMFGGAERTETGGLRGCDDLWLLQLVNDEEDTTTANTCSWTKLSATNNNNNNNNNNNSPKGRNAATLTELSSSFQITTEESQDSKAKYYLLSGGWDPFRTTHADTFVLKMTKTP